MHSVPATLWCEPGATVRFKGARGGVLVVESADASEFVSGRQLRPRFDWRVPLDVPANLLGVLRAVWRKVTGEEAPALVGLRSDEQAAWWLEAWDDPRTVGEWWSPSWAGLDDGDLSADDPRIVPELEGVTDPIEAAAIIARATLGAS